MAIGHSKKKDSCIVSCECSTFYSIFVIVHFIHACTYSSITCKQNDYLSINGPQKTREMSKFKNCKFRKRNGGQKIYTIHHSHFDYEKVPKQDEQVNSLHAYMRLQVKWSSRVIMHRTKINSKTFAISILTASCL